LRGLQLGSKLEADSHPNTVIRFSLLAVVYHPVAETGSDSRRDAIFADMDMPPQHPGAALLVIGHDEIVYRKCYGLAGLETQRPITADSSFYLASIAKQFTAPAIMLLAEQRKLNYEDRLLEPPGPFLPGQASEGNRVGPQRQADGGLDAV
jgi:CubicO group peptidase (beta-lactamase class C family)